MNEKEREFSMEKWKTSMETCTFAQSRTSELADEFTRLQVQIATILLAFVGLFVGQLPKGLGLAAASLKTLYIATIIMVVGSLIVGMLHIKRKEWWWADHVERRAARRKGWEQ